MRTPGLDQRKILSGAAHAACLISWACVPVLVPIAILLLSEDPIVQDNAKQSLNFQINIIIYGIVCFALVYGLLGGAWVFLLALPILFLLGLVSFVMPIFAIVRVAAKPHRPYRYPFVFRFF